METATRRTFQTLIVGSFASLPEATRDGAPGRVISMKCQVLPSPQPDDMVGARNLKEIVRSFRPVSTSHSSTSHFQIPTTKKAPSAETSTLDTYDPLGHSPSRRPCLVHQGHVRL